DLVIDKSKALLLSAALTKRIKGEPLAYILGEDEFMGLKFKVNEDVLIPRPETEVLVETAIRQLSAFSRQLSAIKILEIGTGSGCIAISLAKSLPRAEITAIDISSKALEVAKNNSLLHKAFVKFLQSDLFANPQLRIKNYDLIISNPPYIASPEMNSLPRELRCEPSIALDGGFDGLNFYRRIIKQAFAYSKDGGLLIMEFGYGQRPALENIFQESGEFEIMDIVKDYNNIERVIVAVPNKIWIN
ncbi:MAG: peptide chain release factor N(5)-glutamine methyltransferase, partial [Candidatus Omnitrophica bacterium]|nr:peptide chain release factor N(5)-glutamine methyltransferase [Candidatus Omnitrophota bacterium]